MFNSPAVQTVSPEPGEIVSKRYKIVKLLGVGGMGSVHLAYDLLLDNKKVAIKILHPGLVTDKRCVKAFLREVGLTQEINHENVVRTFDVGHDSRAKFTYFTMEYVNGAPLDELLDRGSFCRENFANVAIQLCLGLQAIHHKNIVHRDLTAGNVIVLNDGLAKIADFGIATIGGTHAVDLEQIPGSPDYVAPEIWSRGEFSIFSDLYSLGVLLYELATGQLPFQEESTSQLMHLHLNTAPISPIRLEPKIAPWLCDIILVLLEKSPSDRPASAKEVADYLTAYSGHYGCFGEPSSSTIVQANSAELLLLNESEQANSDLRTLVGKERSKLPIKQNGSNEEPTGNLNLRKVLVIDDCDNIRHLITAMLSDEMVQLVEAKNGREGLEKVYEHSPTAIICDVAMPIMDGRAFLEKLKANKQTRDIPVLILTAQDSVEKEVDLLTLGARDFVCKTASPKVIITRIRNFINSI